MILALDMYGVILKESKGNFVPYVYSHFPQTEKAALVAFFKQANTGKITGEEFAQALGFADRKAVTKDYTENYLTLDQDFCPFARTVKQSFTMVLLSNDVLSWSEHITAHHNLNPFFAAKFISGAMGFKKPDPEIFRLMLESLVVPGQDCVFVDNSVKNLQAAAQWGIHGILFNRDGESYGGDTVYSFQELQELLLHKYI